MIDRGWEGQNTFIIIALGSFTHTHTHTKYIIMKQTTYLLDLTKNDHYKFDYIIVIDSIDQ